MLKKETPSQPFPSTVYYPTPMQIINPDHSHVCADCHTQQSKSQVGAGRIFNIIALIVLAVLMLVCQSGIGLVIVLVLGAISLCFQQVPKCTACSSNKLIPIDTPAAKKILGE